MVDQNRELAAELVCKTIAALNEEKGSTLRKIRNHIDNEYKIPPDVIKNLIIPSLENGIQFGIIVQNMGRYQLTDLMEKIVDLARKRRKNQKPVYEESPSGEEDRRRSRTGKKRGRKSKCRNRKCRNCSNLQVELPDNPCGGTSESEYEECTTYGPCQEECCQPRQNSSEL